MFNVVSYFGIRPSSHAHMTGASRNSYIQYRPSGILAVQGHGQSRRRHCGCIQKRMPEVRVTLRSWADWHCLKRQASFSPPASVASSTRTSCRRVCSPRSKMTGTSFPSFSPAPLLPNLVPGGVLGLATTASRSHSLGKPRHHQGKYLSAPHEIHTQVPVNGKCSVAPGERLVDRVFAR